MFGYHISQKTVSELSWFITLYYAYYYIILHIGTIGRILVKSCRDLNESINLDESWWNQLLNIELELFGIFRNCFKVGLNAAVIYRKWIMMTKWSVWSIQLNKHPSVEWLICISAHLSRLNSFIHSLICCSFHFHSLFLYSNVILSYHYWSIKRIQT